MTNMHNEPERRRPVVERRIARHDEPQRGAERREMMKPTTAAILVTGLVLSVLIWTGAALFSSSYQAIRVQQGQPTVYILNTRSGDMRLCGPDSCTRVPDR